MEPGSGASLRFLLSLSLDADERVDEKGRGRRFPMSISHGQIGSPRSNE